jgi:hypothetical protein
MKGNQHFKYLPKIMHIVHKPSGQCLDADPEAGQVFLMPCDHSSPHQRWEWATVNLQVIDEWEKNGSKAKGGLQVF